MRARRWMALGATLGCVALAVPAARGASSGGGITFGVPRIVDPIHLYGEPDIKIGPTGDVHVSGPQGTGVQRSIWNLSVDNGDSWRAVQGLPAHQAAAPNKSSAGPGGGDTEIAIAGNNKAFFSDLYSLTCFTAATTSDSGASVASNPYGCSQPPADRQWMAVFDPPTPTATISPYNGAKPLTYLAYNHILEGDNGAGEVATSTDGLNYTHAGMYADTPDTTEADSNVVMDQHTGDLLAAVAYKPDSDHPGLAVAVGTPDAAGALTFHYHVIADTLSGSPGELFPVVAEDTARNLYVAWTQDDDFQIRYSWASAVDDWKTWSKPRVLNRPPSDTNVMPWMAAGGPGIIDVVWYGAVGPALPSDTSDPRRPWNVYMAQVTSAATSHPSITQAEATPHPMHYGDICLLGTACITQVGNRNLADFFQVAIDHDGRARIVYDDTSNGLAQFPPLFEPVDHPGGALPTVVVQQTGINSWTGKKLVAAESTAPVSGIADGLRDALFPPLGGANVPAADVTGVSLALAGGTLHVKVTTAGGPLSDAAAAAGGGFAQLLVRWQMNDTIYYAAAEQSALGGPLDWYAGAAQSVDLCSVSGCKPNYLVYPAPPAGGTTVGGTATGAGPVTYDIAVPAAVVGGAGVTLEEVAAFTTVSASSAAIPLTNAQAFSDIVPLEIEGTRTFNFHG